MTVFFLYQKIMELEKSLLEQEDVNRSLHDQVHRSQRMDAQNQDHMETKQLEIASFKKALNDAKVGRENQNHLKRFLIA